MVNKDFLKKVLTEQKQLLQLSEVKYVHVPHYDELSVKNLYDDFMKLEGVKKYFPNSYPKGR